jgi:hypothetical protein
MRNGSQPVTGVSAKVTTPALAGTGGTGMTLPILTVEALRASYGLAEVLFGVGLTLNSARTASGVPAAMISPRTSTSSRSAWEKTASMSCSADRLLVLVRGEIIAAGTPEAVRADPRVKQVYLGGSGRRRTAPRRGRRRRARLRP